MCAYIYIYIYIYVCVCVHRSTSPGSRGSIQDKDIVLGGGKGDSEYVCSPVIREGREMTSGELRNPRYVINSSMKASCYILSFTKLSYNVTQLVNANSYGITNYGELCGPFFPSDMGKNVKN